MKSGLFNRSLADRGARLAGAPSVSLLDTPRASEKAVLPSLLPGSTVALSQHAMIMVRAVAAYEQRDNAGAITMALADYCQKIGAGPLARAALDAGTIDAGERKVVGLPSLIDDEDLADVPAFTRVGENRFRSGGP